MQYIKLHGNISKDLAKIVGLSCVNRTGGKGKSTAEYSA